MDKKLPKNIKEVKKLKAMITKERASRLEGSFGKEKEHYHLKKINAKTKETEKTWICFGIHTANALEIGKRIWVKKQEKSSLVLFLITKFNAIALS